MICRHSPKQRKEPPSEVSHEVDSFDTRCSRYSRSFFTARCHQRAAQCAKCVPRAVHQRRQGGTRCHDGGRAHGGVRAQGRTCSIAHCLSRRSHAKFGCFGWAPDRDQLAAGARGAGRRTGVAELRLGGTRGSAECRDDGSPVVHPALSDDARSAASGRDAIGGVQERGLALLRCSRCRAVAKGCAARIHSPGDLASLRSRAAVSDRDAARPEFCWST